MPSHTELERKRKRIRDRATALEQKIAAPRSRSLAGTSEARELAEARATRAGKVAVETPEGFEERTPEEAQLIPSLPEQERLEERRTLAEETLPGQFEERGVFREITQEPILPPEQENLGVVTRIIKDLLPDFSTGIFGDRSALKDTFLALEKGEPISQAEITMIEEDIREGIIVETSSEIDLRIDETEGILIQNGLGLVPLATGAAGVLVAQAITRPLAQFIGTDGQIASLELALSQYNEMITIPARSIDGSGLPPEIAFDKYDRMEEGILTLESQLKLSALTSPAVALSLKGRAIEARLIKLKEKLQEGRRIVALRVTQEAFGEVEIPKSVAFLRRLQEDRKKNE